MQPSRVGTGIWVNKRGRGWSHHAGKLVIGMVLVALEVYLLVSGFAALRFTQVVRQSQPISPAAYNLLYEDVTIQTPDGLSLAGWFLPDRSERAIVLVHGMGGCRGWEFGGRFVELAAALQKAGFNVLMIDTRGHGQSEGEHFSLGDLERWDVLGAVAWLQQRDLTRIGALGVSQGAAAVVGAAAVPEAGEAIEALVLDSVYSSLPQTLERHFTEATQLPTLFLPGTLGMVRLLNGANAYTVQPAQQLAAVAAPVLLIGGTRDHLVAPSEFEALHAGRPDAHTWLVSGVGHAGIYRHQPEAYAARVIGFFDKSLR
jgi:pimeloyl-ACP methyl ester carboxylesterase